GEDAIEYTYIKFDGTLFWDSMTIFQCEFFGRQSNLNYMLDTLEIPSKIRLSYKHIDEIVLLAIKTAKIQDEITKLNVDSMNYHNKIEELNSRQDKVINNLHGEEGVEKLCIDILEYCFYDSWAVLLSIIKMQKLVSYRLDAMIYNCKYMQPFCGGKTSMLNCLIAKEYNKEHNYKPVSYKKPNEKHRVVHLIDNNVGTNQDIYFIHEDTQESIIRNILTDLIKKRKEAKKERDKYIGINDIMYNILKQKQLAYKALANALYRGLGSPYLGIAVPVISQCVTFVARELIKTLKKFIELYHTGEYRDDQNVICDKTSEYYSHLKYIELNNGLVKEYEELIFKMYNELTKEGSIFGKKVCDAFNVFNRDCGIKIVTLEYEKLLFDLTLNNKKCYAGYKFELQNNGEPSDYFFS
ncbi:19935_t:CDS:2, partial [Racocetra persica]